MTFDLPAWTQPDLTDREPEREARSGLLGFGRRPRLHPAWGGEGDALLFVLPSSRRPSPAKAVRAAGAPKRDVQAA